MTFVLPSCFKLNSREKSGRAKARWPHHSQWSRVLAFGILCTHCLLAANGSGSLTGSIVDDSGRGVAGARVLVSYASSIMPPFVAPPVVTGPLAAMVNSDANGGFRVDGLTPGRYIGCAEAPASGVLDPCHWSTSAPNFTVSAGQTLSAGNIVMTQGAVLRVHIVDPQGLLKKVTGAIDFDFEIHVVTAKGIHHSVPIQSNNGQGRDHAITIPFDTALNLRVLSPHLAVSDQSGKPFAAPGVAVNVPKGAAPLVIGLTVTGKK